MILKALIYEQLELDGSLKTLKMKPSNSGDEIVVAFPDEYDEPRFGVFHFLDEREALRFREGFANCRVRKLGANAFFKTDAYNFRTNWIGIPTERGWLSYYALSLPEFAIPQSISISDPHKSGREYRRNVSRDDQRNRYVIFLECSSSIGRFDFNLECKFDIDSVGFSSSSYQDPKTEDYGSKGDDWKYWLSNSESERIQHFFVDKIHYGDNYSAQQVGVMGKQSHGHDITLNQTWNQQKFDLDILAQELSILRNELKNQASTALEDQMVGEVANAEIAASEKDENKTLKHLKNAGKWAFDTATKIGVGVAASAIKSAAGL